MKWVGTERLPVSVAVSFSVKVFEWSYLPLTRRYVLAAIEQFEDQATNRQLIVVLEECEDSGTTQKEDVKKTPSKMLPSGILLCIFVVNDNKQIWNVKVQNKTWISVANILSHIMHLDTKYLMVKTLAGNLTVAGKCQVVF